MTAGFAGMMSLPRKIVAFGRNLGVRPRDERPSPVVDADSDTRPLLPLTTVESLLKVIAMTGKDASAEMLMAALPQVEGDLDPRLAPIALSRVGLEGRWEKRSISSLDCAEVPVMLTLKDGRTLLIRSIRDKEHVIIADGYGDLTVTARYLDTLATGDVLFFGHVDPVNGSRIEDERENVRHHPRQWLVKIFLTEKRRLMQLVMTAVFLNLCALAIPLYMRAIYDRVVPNLALGSMWTLSFGVLIVLVFELMFKHVRADFVDSVGLRVSQMIQHRAMNSFLHARLDKSTASVGSMMTALRDVEALAMLVPQAVVTFCVDLPFFFLFLGLIALIGGWSVAGPVVGAAVIASVGLVAAYALKVTAKRSSRLMQARNNIVVDVVEGLSTIKSNQAEGRFLHQWDVVSDHIGIGTRTTRKWSDLPSSASSFMVQFVTIMVVIIGIFQIKAGMMTTGAMIAVTMLTGRAMMPISTAIGVISRGYQSISQFVGLAQLLSLEPETEVSDPSVQGRPVKGKMEFQSLTYAYPGSSKAALRDINLVINPGEKIALIGKSGSGKSTLMQMMAGLLKPDSGQLLIDDHAVSQFAASQLRQKIGYAGQDAVLFDATIRENLFLGGEQNNDQFVENAIRAAGVDRFVNQTDEGFGRKVGPRGGRLSGGQRQAVLLARALIRNPKVVLLDEPTASMDIGSEQVVIQGLQDFSVGRTLIISTHRMTLLSVVDRVIWMDDGKIIADRGKDEILAMLQSEMRPSAAA